VAADRVPYPCRVWTRVGLNCPPGFLALVEDDDDDDDDDDTPTPWQAVGRRLRDRLRSNSDRAAEAAEMALVFDEVQRILGKRTVLQRAAWAEFDLPHSVPRLVRPTTGGRPWKEEVAIAAVIVLAGFAVYRGLNASSGRLARGTAIAGAAGIIAPFLAGLEREPRTLNLIPAFAYGQYIDRRRRRLEEDQSSRETGELIFEEPPGGGAPDVIHFMWWTVFRGFVLIQLVAGSRDAQGRLFTEKWSHWLLTGSLHDLRRAFALLSEQEKQVLQGRIQGMGPGVWIEFGTEPVEDAEPPAQPGSEEEGANAEQVDESVPVGNRW